MYSDNITNEEINELPAAEFTGRVIVVESPEQAKEAEQALKRSKVLGVDTETRPAFRKGQHYKVSLLQLANDRVAVLFRLNKTALTPGIIKILESEKVIKVGAALRDDLRELRRVANFQPAGFVDLQKIVSQWGIEGISVRKMAAIVKKVRVSKAQRLSNWEAQKLTDGQINYAAVDAWICREIYLSLKRSKKRDVSGNFL